jgi:hypothetical protein
MSLLQNSNAISAGGYDINNSLRLRRSNSAFLQRTPASATNQKTWTWSCWVKRGQLSSLQQIFSCRSAGTGENIQFGTYATSEDSITFFSSGSAGSICLKTTQVFRDPSAWYHVVLAVDTTQATASNRVKLYINGLQVTSFITANYPTQNYDTRINSANAHTIASVVPSPGDEFLDGYLTEVNFIDGQALTPSSFGEIDTDTGSWKPKPYSGSYGTNGFSLKFSDIATTSGSNAGLGKDFSGNGNYFNTNNISVTAGTTYDAMKDSPTLTSATVANYATLNPILQNAWWAAPSRGTITNGNLTHASGGNTTAFGNFDLVGNSGKWYYEVTCGATDTNNSLVIAAQSRSTFEVGYYQSGLKQINGATPTGYGSSWTSGDVIGIAIDVPNNNITFYKNNTSQGVINNAFPTGQPVYGGAYYNSTSGDYHYNFGQRPFSYTPPSGYVAMNTYNLPDRTIKKGSSYMDAIIYTGNGTNGRAITTGMATDFVWVKKRSAGDNHDLQDRVRGAAKRLSSNATAAETAISAVASFTSTGFTVDGWGTTNENGFTYVAWSWLANGSGSTNTSGSITSTVSANTTAGFSIATYTGTGVAATIGHGLGVAPKMIIVKVRSTTNDWIVYHSSLGNGNAVYLNLTNANAAATAWNSTSPTSSVFSIGTSNIVNQSSATYVAYCWAEIAGFSKFGSYTGNGSDDGPFVYTGFRPKFIMRKQITDNGDVGGWIMFDNSRDTYNVETRRLLAHSSNAEVTPGNNIDVLSNGWKERNSDGYSNASGQTYIYMAFAENPFKNANAR